MVILDSREVPDHEIQVGGSVNPVFVFSLVATTCDKSAFEEGVFPILVRLHKYTQITIVDNRCDY